MACLGSLAFWRAAAGAANRLRGLGLRRQIVRGPWWSDVLGGRFGHVIMQGRKAAALAKLAGEGASEHAEVRAQIQTRVNAEIPPHPSDLRIRPERSRYPSDVTQAEAWDRLYTESIDPWDYSTSEYERVKYEETLELLPHNPPANALELACAEGVFTRMLARRVGKLTATDISAVAVSRAAKRCGDLENVTFRTLDFSKEPLPQGYDLIVCSEVLYFTGSRAQLRRVTHKIANSLAPGGILITAHAKQKADEPGGSGFDWAENFGSKTIRAAFLGAGLGLQREIETPLYRVSAFRRPLPGEDRSAGQVEQRPLRATLEPRVEATVLREPGYGRAVAARRELTMRVPILNCSGFDWGSNACKAAFEANMRRLRRLGYHSISLQDLVEARAANTPLAGRPLILTFDGEEEGFAGHAWPTLQRYGLGAVLLVDPLSGAKTASGSPDGEQRWDRLRSLVAEGVQVGVAIGAGCRLSKLPNVAAYEALLRAKRRIQVELDPGPMAVRLLPSDDVERLKFIVADCGFDLGFASRQGCSHLNHDPFDLPGISLRPLDQADDLEIMLRCKRGRSRV